MNERDLSAREAAARLGVKLPTLYAYVSRGLLRSRPGAHGRARRYLLRDVEALRQRGSRAAQRALRWGEPILESGITAMGPAGPLYRGHAALELARANQPFEAVAELLWTGLLPEPPPRWPVEALPGALTSVPPLLPTDAPPSAVGLLLVAADAARDPGRFDLRTPAILQRARRLIRLLAAGLALPEAPERAREAWRASTLAEGVARACGLRPRLAALRAIDRCLVLLADHELNASTFAARVAASTHAELHACVLAGLAALSGPLHGAASDRVEALLAELRRPERAEHVVFERSRRGELLPGFGHEFYPSGDPRARLLLETVQELGGRSPQARALLRLAAVMEEAGRPSANVDAALVALRAALGMRPGAAAGLFGVARAAGWVAHALEQVHSGELLRPRARYRGEAPPSA